MVDYKKAVEITKRYNAKLEKVNAEFQALTAEYNEEMQAEFGDKHISHYEEKRQFYPMFKAASSDISGLDGWQTEHWKNELDGTDFFDYELDGITVTLSYRSDEKEVGDYDYDE